MILRASLWRFCCICFLAGLAVTLLSGCIQPRPYPHQPLPSHQQSPSHQPDYSMLGNLQADGPHVYYNHRPTSGGHPIRSGDNVSTGENSRAMVRLINGGVVTIDQNTDPDFFKEAWCILVTIFKGQVSTDGSGICIETPHLYALIKSKVNIVVTDRETIVTVLSGSVTMERPVNRILQRYQQARVSRRGIQSVRSLSARQLKSVFPWRDSRSGRQRDPKIEQCRRYAKTAVSQQEENLRRGCRFKGNEWSADFNQHYDWCLKVPPSRADAVNRERAEALKRKCAPAPQANKRQQCRRYAETAVSQQKENLRRGCRFKGSEWSADFDYHYDWCLQVSPSRADAVNRERAEALKRKCAPVPRANKEQRCRRYAETAVSQQAENLRRGCRLRGNRWSDDFRGHYEWCLQVPQSQADSEARERDKSLKKCQK